MANQARYSFDELPDYIKNAPAFKNPVVEVPVVKETVIEQPIITEPVKEIAKSNNSLYGFLKDRNLTDLNETDFLKAYSTKEGAKEIHDYMSMSKDDDGNRLTTLNYNDFYNQFLNPYNNGFKKKDFITTGLGSENLSQDLGNIEDLGSIEDLGDGGPGKKKKKTTEVNLTSNGKPLTGELKAKVLTYMRNSGQNVVDGMDINPKVLDKANSAYVFMNGRVFGREGWGSNSGKNIFSGNSVINPGKQLRTPVSITKNPGEDDEAFGFRKYFAEKAALDKQTQEDQQMQQSLSELNKKSSNHGFVQLDQNDPYYPGYINSLTGGREGATVVAGAINKADFQNYKAGVIAEETKKAAIQNTLNRKAFIPSGPNHTRASDSTMLADGINSGQYVVTQDNSGYPILGLPDYDLFNSYDNSYNQLFEKEADEKYLKTLSDEDKYKYKENQAYQNSISTHMPQVPSGFKGNLGSFLAGFQRTVEKPIIYGIGAASGAGLVGEAAVGAAAVPELVQNARSFGNAVGWMQQTADNSFGPTWDRTYYGQLANIPNPTEAQKLAASKMATNAANNAQIVGMGEGFLLSVPFGKLTPGLENAAKSYDKAIQTVRKAAPRTENSLLNKVAEVGKNAKTTIPQMYGASFAGELGKGEIAAAYGSGESQADIFGGAHEMGVENAKTAGMFTGLHITQAIVPHALGVLMTGNKNVPASIITNRAYEVASQLPAQNLKEIFAKAEQDGIMKPGEGEQILNNIEQYRKAKSLVPKNVTNPEAAISMAGFIQKIEGLKEKLKTAPTEQIRKDQEAEIAEYEKKINGIYYGDDPLLHETDKLNNPLVQTAGLSGQDFRNMLKGVTNLGSKAYGKVKEFITGKSGEEAPQSKEQVVDRLLKEFDPNFTDPNYEHPENDKIFIQNIKDYPIEIMDRMIESSKNNNNIDNVKKFEKLKEDFLNAVKAEDQAQIQGEGQQGFNPAQQDIQRPETKEQSINNLIKMFVPDDPNYEMNDWDKDVINRIKNNPVKFIDELIDYNKREIEANPKGQNTDINIENIKRFEDIKQNYLNTEKAEGKGQQAAPIAEIPVVEEVNQPMAETEVETPVLETENKGKINEEDINQGEVVEGAPKRVSGVSHDALENIAERLGLPKIERGTVLKPEEYAARGRKLVDGGIDPESVRGNVNNPTPDEISIARAHLIDLDNNLDAVGKEFGIDSQEYKDAKAKVDDWARNVVKIQNTTFAERGTAMQGVTDLDTGSFSSVSRKLEDNLGRPLTPKEQEAVQKKAEQNRASEQAQKNAESNLISETDKELGEGSTPTEGPKLYKEKAKVVADKFRKLKTKEFTFKDENGNDIPIHKMGASWNEMIEIGAKAIEATGEIADGVKAIVDQVKDKDWYKNLSKRDKANFEDQLASQLQEPIVETPESKNIARLEKQLDDLQNGKYKEKATPRELSDREKELKAQIKAEKEKLGLISNKSKTPLTEEEELSNLQAQFVDKKGNKFTPDEAKSIWKYIKKNYIDKGVEYNESLRRASEDLGMNYEQVANAVVTPKTKKMSNEYYAKRGIANKNRQATKQWVEEKNQSNSVKIFRKIWNFPKALMTFGHGHVFIGTHGATNLADPKYVLKTVKGMVNAYKYAYGNKGNYERDMEALKNHPLYRVAREAGLANDPDVFHFDDADNYKSFVKKVGQTGERGFNAIKVLRQQIFNNEYEGLTESEKQNPEVVKRIAGLVNNWTGATNVNLPNVVKDLGFSSNMEASRWERLGSGPKALGYALKGLTGNGTPDQKAFAKVWFKRAGRQVATYGSLLAANAVVQHYKNPDREVNFTDPTKSDFLLPKFGKHDITLDLSGGMLSALGLMSRLTKYATIDEKKLPRGKTRGEAQWESVGGYLRGKLNPAAAIAVEAATGKDFSGNAVPWSNDKLKGEQRKLGWGEYMAGHTLMLPLAEGFHVMQKSAKDNGLSPFDFENLMKGLEVAAISGATGIKTKEVKDDVEEPAELEKVLNYRQKGRPITPEERKIYESRSEQIYNILLKQNEEEGVPMTSDDNKYIIKATKKGLTDKNGNILPVLTKEEKYKELNRLKEEAANYARKELFGIEKPTVRKIVSQTKLEQERLRRRRLLKLNIPKLEEEYEDPDFLNNEEEENP